MELEMLKTIIEKTLGRNMDAITEKTTFVDNRTNILKTKYHDNISECQNKPGTEHCGEASRRVS